MIKSVTALFDILVLIGRGEAAGCGGDTGNVAASFVSEAGDEVEIVLTG